MTTRFKLSDEVIELRNEAQSRFLDQSAANQICSDYSTAAYRRIFRHAEFKVVSTEYLAVCDLKTHLPRFGKVLFPFEGIESGEGPFDTEIIEQAKKTVEDRCKSTRRPFPPTEYDIRINFLDQFFQGIFNRYDLKRSEYLSSHFGYYIDIKDHPETLRLDRAVVLFPLRNYIPFMCPLICIEYAWEPLLPCFAHYDEPKTVFSMATFLLKLMRHTKHLGVEFMKTLFVQGILTSGYDIEFVVMKPQFGEPVVENGVKTIPFCLIHSSSREHCRISLFKDADEPETTQAIPQWGSSTNSYEMIFDNSGSEVKIEPSTQYDHQSQWDQMVRIRHIENELNSCNKAIFQGADSSSSSSWTRSLSTTTSVAEIQRMADDHRSTQGREVNMACLRAIDRAKQAAEHLAKTLVEALTENPGPNLNQKFESACEDDCGLDLDPESWRHICSNRSYDYPPRSSSSFSAKLMDNIMAQKVHKAARPDTKVPEARKNEMRGHGESDSDTDKRLLRKFRAPFKWKENGRVLVSVLKSKSEYELEVYNHEVIKASPFIPECFKSTDLSEKYVLLELEAVTPIRDYCCGPSDFFNPFELSINPKPDEPDLLTMARILLDGMGALKDIHAAGFVHSDVSANNIGYNEHTGIWQIFDFNQAMPIEKSLVEVRHGGTSGFRSTYYDVIGIARPVDDYVSLIKSIKYEFDSHTKCKNQEVFQSLFHKINQANDIGDVDVWYKEAFEVFCKVFSWFETTVNELKSDPSYLAALKNLY